MAQEPQSLSWQRSLDAWLRGEQAWPRGLETWLRGLKAQSRGQRPGPWALGPGPEAWRAGGLGVKYLGFEDDWLSLPRLHPKSGSASSLNKEKQLDDAYLQPTKGK